MLETAAVMWMEGYCSRTVEMTSMLVMEMGRRLPHRDFLLAEILAQSAVLPLQRKQPGNGEIHQNMDDIVFLCFRATRSNALFCIFPVHSSPFLRSITCWRLCSGIIACMPESVRRFRVSGICALDHISRNLPFPLTPSHLVSPERISPMEHDQEKGAAYFETLREYLLLERDIPKTSEALIIHQSTLLYRLKKSRFLIHTGLEDPWQQLYLMLSLGILEHTNRK